MTHSSITFMSSTLEQFSFFFFTFIVDELVFLYESIICECSVVLCYAALLDGVSLLVAIVVLHCWTVVRLLLLVATLLEPCLVCLGCCCTMLSTILFESQVL